MCGEKADSYSIGTCQLRWVYLLAVIAFCDAIILGEYHPYLDYLAMLATAGCLALTLATKKLKYVEEDPAYGQPRTVYHGEINPGFVGDTQSLYGSRKAIYNKPGVEMNQGWEDDG